MTFAEYWEEHEPFGSNPEDVAKLAWYAAINAERERCAKIAEGTSWWPAIPSPLDQHGKRIAAKIREPQ